MTHKLIKTDNYLLVVDDSEIKVGDWIKAEGNPLKSVDVIYVPTTKKIISHLPLNDSPILEGVDLLPPYHQEDGVEKLAEIYPYGGREGSKRLAFIEGYNKACEKYKYTEEDMRKAWNAAFTDALAIDEDTYEPLFFEKFIKSIHQYPTEFECEMEVVETDWNVGDVTTSTFPKTITTAQGIQWVGKYK